MSLLFALPAALTSWGPILVALATSVVGLLTEGASWLVLGAVAAAVPSFDFAHQPGHGWAYAVPAVLGLAAWQVRQHRKGVAALMVAGCGLAAILAALL